MVFAMSYLCESDLEEAERIITVWMIQFLDPDRPKHPPMGPVDLIGRLRRHGWELVRRIPTDEADDAVGG